jgi:short-subunit dehydrogenase
MTNSKPNGTALITGASTGIGATYADRLARRGHDLILVARNRLQLEQGAARLRATHGVAVEPLVADLTSKADLLAVERRLRDDPAISLLVNNAGMTTPPGLVGADLDRLEDMIQLNVVAVTRLAGAAATAFAARGEGIIVNLSSVLALAPELGNGVYSGTKSYVLNLSIAMQAELAPRGVRVQVVMPGATRTEIWERGGADLSKFPPSMVMEAGELVDSALVGLDLGEVVTIPSLPDAADWEALTAARLHLRPNLSRDRAAPRYQAAA